MIAGVPVTLQRHGHGDPGRDPDPLVCNGLLGGAGHTDVL